MIGRRIAAVVVAVVVGVGGGGCTRHSSIPPGAVVLDGSPRVPDVEGVAVQVAKDFSTVTLDDHRTYKLAAKVQSFSTVDGSTQSIRARTGQYVQAHLRGGRIVWLAWVGAVDRTDPNHPVAYYIGTLRARAGDRLEFKDGTVLRASAGANLTGVAAGARLLATIDVTPRRVVGVAPQ